MSGTYNRDKRKGQINPAVSYNFGLQVEAMFFVPLRAVRVFTKENEFDYYQEGGLNDYVHMLRKPISKPFTFQVEKYVGTDSGMFDQNSGFVDPLALGTELILPVVLFVNRAQTKNAGENFSFNNCARAYIFTGCTVISKEYGELNSEQSKLLVDTTTIAYKELFAINQFNPSAERGDPWAFDSSKGYLGTDNHFAARQKNEKRTAQETKGNTGKWQISKNTYEGNKLYHTKDKARKNDSKATGEQKGNAGKWDFMDHPAEGTVGMAKPTYKGNGKFHTKEISRKNDPKSQGEQTGKEKMWEISKDTFDGNKKFHTDERGRKNRSKTDGEAEGKGNEWIYDGSVNGKGKSHPENRSKNTKPTPVKWPPTRRARQRAEALSGK